MTTVRELVAKFGVDFDDKGAKKAETSIDALKEGFRGLLGVIGGAELIKHTWEFVKGQVEMANQIKITSERIGVSTDELQKFRFAANANAISSEVADNALQRFSMNMGAVGKHAGPASKAAHDLGIKLKEHGQLRPVADVLGDVADKMQKLKTPQEQLRLAFNLFGRGGQQMASVLKDGRKGLEEYGAEAEELGGIMSGDEIEAAHKVEVGMHKLSFAYQGVKNQIMDQLLPSLTKALRVLLSWAKGAREMAKGTHIFEAAVAALAVTLAVLGWPLIGPLVAAGLAMAAIALALDDVITFAKGGDSIIGDLVDSMLDIGAAKTVLDDYKAGLVVLRDFVVDEFVPDWIAGFDAIERANSVVAESLLAEWKTLIWPFKQILLLMAKLTGEKPPAWLTEEPPGPADPKKSSFDERRTRKVAKGRGVGAAAQSDEDVRKDVYARRAARVARRAAAADALNRPGPGSATPEHTVHTRHRHVQQHGAAGAGTAPAAIATVPSAPSAAPVTINQQTAVKIEVNGATHPAVTAKHVREIIAHTNATGHRNAVRAVANHGEKPAP